MYLVEISVRFFENKAQTSEAILASDFCESAIFDISFISNSGLAIYIQYIPQSVQKGCGKET